MKSWVPLTMAGLVGIFLVSVNQLGYAQCGCCGMMDDRIPQMDASKLPDPSSKGANLLQRYCTQCHNLPAPVLHSPEEWPPVVDRMVNRMRRMGGRGMMGIKSPAGEEVKLITTYLQKHALQP